MSMPIPTDFPRNPFPSAVGGAQNKFSARRIGGKYVVGLTDDELIDRYEVCADLVEQLVKYCLRKERENPDWTHAFIIERTANGLGSERIGLGLSLDETGWVMLRVIDRLSWNDSSQTEGRI